MCITSIIVGLRSHKHVHARLTLSLENSFRYYTVHSHEASEFPGAAVCLCARAGGYDGRYDSGHD